MPPLSSAKCRNHRPVQQIVLRDKSETDRARRRGRGKRKQVAGEPWPRYAHQIEGRGQMVKAEASIKLESFELVLRDIADIEVEKLHALSLSVGWPHRPQDCQMLREAGQGIVAVDGIGRVLASAMWFAFGDDFATIGMVITSPRLQAHGTGRWLMDNVFTHTGSRFLGLNATRAARRLYRSLDFASEKTVYQCQGIAIPSAAPVLPAGTRLREVSFTDLDTLYALDYQAYGAPRSA